MITWATDAQKNVLAIQLTRLTPEGRKAQVKYVRTTHRGPHNWKSRAILRLNCDDGPIDTVHLVEGFEDGLSLVMAGVKNVWVLWGIGRLRRLERDLFPLGLKTIIVVRDDDGGNPDPSAEHSLWRGVTHLEGFGKEVKVTPRPRMVTGAPNSVKDVNDLLCHGGVGLVQALMKAKPVGKEDLNGADREEIFDQASWMGRDEYDQGREAIAKRLDVRVGTLDEERKARHEKRAAETRQNEAPNRDEFILKLLTRTLSPTLAQSSTVWLACLGKFSPPLPHISIQKRCGPPRRICCCARSWASGIPPDWRSRASSRTAARRPR